MPHLIDCRAATATRGALRDDKVSIGSNFTEKFADRCSICGTSAVAPDKNRKSTGVASLRSIDCVLRKTRVGGRTLTMMRSVHQLELSTCSLPLVHMDLLLQRLHSRVSRTLLGGIMASSCKSVILCDWDGVGWARDLQGVGCIQSLIYSRLVMLTLIARMKATLAQYKVNC